MKEAVMTGRETQTERDLAFRSFAGIEVRLLWRRESDELRVTAFDSSTGEWLELPARPEQALDVFNHPFAYARAA
jgi:hypothetical protein